MKKGCHNPSKDSEFQKQLRRLQKDSSNKEVLEFTEDVWDTKIRYGKRISDIFEQSGGKTNAQIHAEIEEMIQSVLGELSEEEKSTVRHLEYFQGELEKVSTQLVRNGEKLMSCDNDTIAETLESEQIWLIEEQEAITETLSGLMKLSWKAPFITHMTERLRVLEGKMKQVEEFKRYAFDADFIPLKLQGIMKQTPHQIRYSNFWVHVFIHDENWPFGNGRAGMHFTYTPLTINRVFPGKKTENKQTIEHESRHNIFDGLFEKPLSPKVLIGAIDRSIQRYIQLQRLGDKLQPLIENELRLLTKNISNLAKHHLEENKDEILANFEGLANGTKSTEISKYHSDLKALETLRKSHMNDMKYVTVIDCCIEIFKKDIHAFYKHLLEYLFIGSKHQKLEDIRILLYWISLDDHSIIESFLRSKIGDTQYNNTLALQKKEGKNKVIQSLQTLTPEEILLWKLFRAIV